MRRKVLPPELRRLVFFLSLFGLIVSAVLSSILTSRQDVKPPVVHLAQEKKSVSSNSSYDDVLVTRVIDGDTFELEDGQRVRMIGIDTPESRSNAKAIRDSQRSGEDIKVILDLGKEAKGFVKELLEHKRVRLELDTGHHDKYGRLLAYVYLKEIDLEAKVRLNKFLVRNAPQEIFVNATIVKAGYASPLTIAPNVKFAELFKNLYREARNSERGLWQSRRLAQGEASD